ncbi:MAG: DRTGG domain-containing protein [bacterium]|nr:DRTGG domain-containing protein [bacterium]
MTVGELATKYSLRQLAVCDTDRVIEGVYIGDLLSWVMGRASAGNAWITIMSNINIVAVATLVGVSCIILAEGVTLDDEVIKVALSKGVNILASDNDAYELSVMLSKVI